MQEEDGAVGFVSFRHMPLTVDVAVAFALEEKWEMSDGHGAGVNPTQGRLQRGPGIEM